MLNQEVRTIQCLGSCIIFIQNSSGVKGSRGLSSKAAVDTQCVTERGRSFWQSQQPVFSCVSVLVPRGLVESVFIVCSSLFMFSWEHARSLSCTLILLPDSGSCFCGVGEVSQMQVIWSSAPGQLVSSGQATSYLAIFLVVTNWVEVLLAGFYNAGATPTTNYLAPNFH